MGTLVTTTTFAPRLILALTAFALVLTQKNAKWKTRAAILALATPQQGCAILLRYLKALRVTTAMPVPKMTTAETAHVLEKIQ
jgi:cobalamin biosynthesis protein CbiG